MKRVVRSKSGREIYGPKWRNASPQVSGVTPPPPETEINAVDDEGINIRGNLSNLHYSMYKACVEGDCVAAEMLLGENPNLAWEEISEEGDRALHIAASMKHLLLVQKIIERMSCLSDLELLDGRGYSACCHAAISDAVEIADCMITKNPRLAIAHDRENKTPILKATLRGNWKMVSYFLKSVKLEDLSTHEWFDLLLETIRLHNYGLALEILSINKQVATMSNNEGTALHVLAEQRFYVNDFEYMRGEMKENMRLLAEKLLAGIETLGECGAVELMTNPSILHTAARLGNVKLITMVTQNYPQLVWHKNNKGHTIFHIAVKYRHELLFMLINDMGGSKDLIAQSQDEDGNTILHLVGELEDRQGSKYLIKPGMSPAFELQEEKSWLEEVKETVPPLCRRMKNKNGETAEEVFSKRHERLKEESRTWMRNVSDSCMLIATLILTVMFGFAFAVPGGYDQYKGIPLLLGTNWFTIFVICEGLAMFSSAFSLLFFLTIMMFGERIRLWVFVFGIYALTTSVYAALSVFTSAFFLIYSKKRVAPVPLLIKSFITLLYLLMVFAVAIQLNSLGYLLPKKRSLKGRYTLFKQPAAVMVNKKRRFWIF